MLVGCVNSFAYSLAPREVNWLSAFLILYYENVLVEYTQLKLFVKYDEWRDI